MSISSDGAVGEIPLEEALETLECNWETQRIPFSDAFWGKAGKEGVGVYEELKRYKPCVGAAPSGGNALSSAVQAVAAINKHKASLTSVLSAFAGDVAEDIQNYGTLPSYTVAQIAKVGNVAAEEDARQMLVEMLEGILRLRGADYLAKIRKRYEGETVIVTVEKR